MKDKNTNHNIPCEEHNIPRTKLNDMIWRPRYQLSGEPTEMILKPGKSPVYNLPLMKNVHPRLQTCYDILIEDVIVDTPYELFEGLFKRNAYCGKVTFGLGVTIAQIHYLFTTGFFEYLTADKHKWERLSNCIQREDGTNFTQKQLSSPNYSPEGNLYPVLKKAIEVLKKPD